MAAETDLGTIAQEIHKALEELVGEHPGRRVEVFESQPGNLRAIVVSDFFKGMGLSDRQERIWAFLKTRLLPDYLLRLYGVHPYDVQEFVAGFQVSSAEPLRSSMTKSQPEGDDTEKAE